MKGRGRHDDDDDEDGDDGGGGGGGCVGKTPVSLLQELYVRRGMVPKYDLVQIEGAVHEPTFKYRVTIGEFVATGCGQSKKKAKHCAAKAILDKLLGAQNAGVAPPGQPTIPDLAQDIFSPYDDGIQGNPVGILQELCMSRRWPPPTYDLSHEDGLPHERSFTLVCVIGKYRETGAGKSKKLAKRQAAHKMIKRLQLLPHENEDKNQNIDEDDLAQGISMRYSQLKEANIKTLNSSNNSQVSKFHKNLQSSVGACLNKLQALSLSEPTVEHVKLLAEIGSEQHFTIVYVEIEELSKTGRYQCMVQLSTLPVAVLPGSGESPEEAKQSAAQSALEYLKILTRK